MVQHLVSAPPICRKGSRRSSSIHLHGERRPTTAFRLLAVGGVVRCCVEAATAATVRAWGAAAGGSGDERQDPWENRLGAPGVR
jgi:hypothetical protein